MELLLYQPCLSIAQGIFDVMRLLVLGVWVLEMAA